MRAGVSIGRRPSPQQPRVSNRRGRQKILIDADKPELGIDAERAAADARKIGAAVGEPDADGW